MGFQSTKNAFLFWVIIVNFCDVLIADSTTTPTVNSTAASDANATTTTAEVETWPITWPAATLAQWEKDDSIDMVSGIGMGVGVGAGCIAFIVIVVCIFCKVKIDKQKEYLEKVAEAKRKMEMQERLDKMRQRAPGISNELVTGYAGGISNTWDPFRF